MKTFKELEEIRDRVREEVDMRKDRTGTRVVVGMATCGIAAGARPVLLSFVDEVKKRNLKDVIVSQTGCIGVCYLEPIVEVYKPGEEKVTYVKMTADKAKEIVEEHILGGKPITRYTIGAYEYEK
jgi:NADP-reducing hydrogenase subunit HndB